MTRERALELAWDVVIDEHKTFGDWQSLIADKILAAVAEENEECAKIADDTRHEVTHAKDFDCPACKRAQRIASKIRARGIPLKVGA